MVGWYSEEPGLPLKTRLRMGIASNKAQALGQLKWEISINFSDFNEPVSIELPEGAKDAVPLSVLENLLENLEENFWEESTGEAETSAENAVQAAREAAQDDTSPTISMIEPMEGLVTSNDTVKVSGTVSDDVASYDEITLNVAGNAVIVQSDGSFSTTVALEHGTNNIVVVATDGVGNSNSKTRTVQRKQ